MDQDRLGRPELQLKFSKSPEAPAVARRALRSYLGSPEHGAMAAGLVDDATLILSELVTNVLRHTGNGGTVRARRTPDGVRLEVSDTDPHPPLARIDVGVGDHGGHGLHVVGAIAARWGVTTEPPGGKTVWAHVGGTDSR